MGVICKAKYKELGFNSSHEYRKAYARMKSAQKRGHDCNLDDFKKPRTQFVKGRSIIYHRKYRAFRIGLATPKWIDFEEIYFIYNNCPLDMVVDHIIPLRGKNVSGLNVPWNLQYLTVKENASKGNNF